MCIVYLPGLDAPSMDEKPVCYNTDQDQTYKMFKNLYFCSWFLLHFILFLYYFITTFFLEYGIFLEFRADSQPDSDPLFHEADQGYGSASN